MTLKQNILTFLFFLGYCFVHSQQSELSNNIEAEAKAASKTINYKANINIVNYDVTFYRMDWIIDHVVAFIKLFTLISLVKCLIKPNSPNFDKLALSCFYLLTKNVFCKECLPLLLCN